MLILVRLDSGTYVFQTVAGVRGTVDVLKRVCPDLEWSAELLLGRER